MQDIIQRQREEFHTKRLKQATHCEDCECKILLWHTSSIKQIIQALIEREESKKCIKYRGFKLDDNEVGYNQAKQDTITHLKQLLNN